MAAIELSEAEKIFVLHGVQDDVRVDGRSRKELRPLKFETELVTHANGSAHLRLANTDVLVGVKAELDLEEKTSHGIEFFVDCSANATPDFEGKGGEALATELSNTLSKAYNDKSVFDYSILRGQDDAFSWILNVDILILEVGGNLFDAVSLAVKAALFSTTIPRVNVATIDGGQPELEITDDPLDGTRLDVSKSPILITLSRIGNFCVIDPTPEEEACSSASLVIGVTPSGKVTVVKKCGSGTFNLDSMTRAISDASEIGAKIQTLLMEKLLKEDRMGIGRKKVGFLKE